ncbi:MAG: hypothetical protein KDD58_14760 [Bdellovibrionales bacterium]|nr:hypothetical protein [Bdellovibrionales bacterium]
MKRVLRTSIIIIALGLAVSCSEQEFSSVPSDACVGVNNNHGDGACITDPETGMNAYNYSVGSCKADILFVIDNSGSMYEDQVELANRFPNFLSAINHLDYNIAITTTDISSSPNNYDPNDVELIARQDGRFIKFPNGQKFITKSTPNAQSAFEATVKRPETQNCDSGNKSACPTSDERGIYAVNYALNTAQERGNLGPNSFFRPDSHFAIVFLSDENVRSDAYVNIDVDNPNPLYKPVEQDTPQSLIDSVTNILGSGSTFSAHPIVIQSAITHSDFDSKGILTPSHDVACKDEQAAQSGTSRPDMWRYGTWYEQLSTAATGTVDGSTVDHLGGLVKGHAGSICDTNYTPNLTKIGESIAQNTHTTNLLCDPTELKVKIGDKELNDSEYELEGSLLKLPATCEKVNVTYKCPANI